jgi:lipoate-protein ligase A
LRWRLLLDRTSDPTINLAIEEAIVRSRRDSLCQDTLRIWRNDRSVILGCNSRVHDEVDLEVCKRIGVRILRRTSGGGAVYHDLGNVNCSVVVKEEHMHPNYDLPDTYEQFAKAVLKGLSFLNVKAEFRKPNSIFLNGRKISGMAQHRFYDVILLHGTLLVNSDLQVLSSTLLHPKDEVTNSSREASGYLSEAMVEEALVAGFREVFRINFGIETLSPYESRLAMELVAIKYATEKWNLRTDEELTVEGMSSMPVVESLGAHDPMDKSGTNHDTCACLK